MSKVPKLGSVRRSQVVSTYGIGAIVDLESGSFMPLGLEEWEKQTRLARKSTFTIYEARLQARLGVQEFRMAPILEEVRDTPNHVKSEYSLPVIRFPRWLECPKCHRLGREGQEFEVSVDGKRAKCARCNQGVNPVRFVAACARGHLSDFPWIGWAHMGREDGICDKPLLYLRSKGESASLGDLFVACENCKSSKSLAKAYKKSALARFGTCQGKRPWLLDSEDCDQLIRTAQRGGSNIHFAAAVSSLSIPPLSEPIQQVIDEHWSVYRFLPEENLREVLAGSADELGIPLQLLIEACRRRQVLESGADSQEEKTDLRLLEYTALSSSTADIPAIGGHVAEFQNEVSDPPASVSTWFDSFGAVSRLREVRALVGFSRIEPQPVTVESARTLLQNGHLSPLSKSRMSWLPAAEIRGEGIFIRFSSAAIDNWIAENPAVVDRALEIDRCWVAFAQERGFEPDYSVSPRLLLVHSFAHIMIRRLAIECGYSSAALRERLYIKDADGEGPAMQGVLIYTGTPDSEGSLGGLVRLADPNLLASLITRALRDSRWCGSDPVCLETDPELAGERISGASCHCCLLVPETACEKFNRELDRSLLVGDTEGRWKGFFENLLDSNIGE